MPSPLCLLPPTKHSSPRPVPHPHLTVLVQGLITTCLDWWNSLPIGLPHKSLHKLELFLTSAACIIRDPLHPPHHSCTPPAPVAPSLLHIQFKILPVTVKATHNLSIHVCPTPSMFRVPPAPRVAVCFLGYSFTSSVSPSSFLRPQKLSSETFLSHKHHFCGFSPLLHKGYALPPPFSPGQTLHTGTGRVGLGY